MVLKVSKGGIRSGNSFKRINKFSYQRKYRTHAVIIRNLILTGDNIERQNFIGEVDIKANRIPYSINKKGRWELPGLIQNKIEEGEFDDQEYAVQVVERHKLFRKSNCISVHTSRAPWAWNSSNKGRDRNIGYLNVTSLLDGRRRRRRHRIRARQVITRRGRRIRLRSPSFDRNSEDEEDEVVPSSVRYEVLYPPSPTSGVNYTRSVRDPYQADYCPCRRRCYCNKKICNKSNKFRSLIKEEMEYLENNEEEDVSMFGNPFRYSSENVEASCVFNLSDLLKNNKHSKETRRNRKRRKSSQSNSESEEDTYKNKKIIYEKVAATETSHKVAPVQEVDLNTSTNNFDAVVVKLSNKETNPQELRYQYGERYTECGCFPRKFIIDISERVQNFNLHPLITKRTTQFRACVVFTLDPDNKANTGESSIFKVIFNTSSAKHMKGCRIETLFDYMESTVAECIQRTVLYIETVPMLSGEFGDTSSPVLVRNTKHKTSSVSKWVDWTSDTYIPNDDIYLSTYLRTESLLPKKINLDHGKTKEISSLENKLCDICYEFLGEQTPGTALKSCGHWFCDGCWTEYLKDRINSASITLTCPEFDCDNVVDIGTALSILEFRDIIKHAKYCHDNKVERDDVTKWCPNTNCDRVIIVNSSDVKVVNCKCGQTFCFDCFGEPHWPVPCDAFTNYYKKLKETGDIGLAPVESLDHVIVNGKTCPHCKKFLEKDGGCPFMACVCGGTFCWGCGRDWNSNSHGNECYKHGYKNEHMTKEVTIEDDRRKSGNKKLQWYNVAVKHRTELHPVKLRQLKNARSKLVKHLGAFIGKMSKRGVCVKLDFEGKKTSYTLEQAKLPEYLNELIALHQDLSRVAESTALIMDSNKLPQGSVLRLQFIINRLSVLAEGISKGFLSGSNKKPEELLAIFKKVRVHSVRTIKCLQDTVNILDL